MIQDLEQVARDVLNEMYAEAEPPLDFEYARKNPDDQPEDWYQRHYLNAKRQQEILDKHIEQFERELSSRERSSLYITCITSLGPTGSKELAEERRTES